MMAPMQPLTHHEIMSLAAPFARSGRHVDLAASDRPQRRLAFKVVAHAAVVDGLPAWRESLLLELPHTGRHRLTRTLTLAEGLQATLVGEGDDAGMLLAAVQAVPAERQLQRVAGHWVAFNHRVAPGTGALQLTGAATQLAGLCLQMSVSRVQGIAAELTLAAPAGVEFTLPEDLLAVLGLPWSRLSHAAGQWRASIQLRGNEHKRSQDAEHKFARSVEHLAQTLADTPAQFHQRFVRQRWLVTLRRATPLGMAVGLVIAALLVPRLELGSDSVLRMLIFNSPPLLLAWIFSMREMPHLEIPPLPRRPALPGWQAEAAPAPADTPSSISR
jgi:hypothetical protein